MRFSSIGDIILTTPLVRCLRKKYPEARISFIIKKEFADLMRHNPHIDKLIVFDKSTGFSGLKQLKEKIKKENYDWIIDIHKSLRSRYLKIFSGAKLKTKYHKLIFRRSLLVRFKLNLYGHYKPVYLRYFDAVRKAGIQYDGQGTEVFFQDSDFIKVKELAKLDDIPGREIVTVCPGASFSNKIWSIEGFTAVGKYLKEERNMKVVLLGGKKDVDLCENIHRQLGNSSINLSGKLSLLQSAALLSMCKVVITNDSGMMHMAQSQKKPVVAIFGPTVKELGYFPIEENSCVVETPIRCRPCTHNGLDYCPKKHHRCMKNISSLQVINATLELMDH